MKHVTTPLPSYGKITEELTAESFAEYGDPGVDRELAALERRTVGPVGPASANDAAPYEGHDKDFT